MPATSALFIRAQAETKTVAGSVLCRPTMSRATCAALVARLVGARGWRRARRARRSWGVNFRIVVLMDRKILGRGSGGGARRLHESPGVRSRGEALGSGC